MNVGTIIATEGRDVPRAQLGLIIATKKTKNYLYTNGYYLQYQDYDGTNRTSSNPIELEIAINEKRYPELEWSDDEANSEQLEEMVRAIFTVKTIRYEST